MFIVIIVEDEVTRCIEDRFAVPIIISFESRLEEDEEAEEEEEKERKIIFI